MQEVIGSSPIGSTIPMLKHSFYNDYSEGAHPAILALLGQNNQVQEKGYGLDSCTLKASELIQKAIGNPEADLHLVSNGTQANLIALASMLKPYESVISAQTGHINVHETGAVEATGHKINLVGSSDGKLTVEGIDQIVKSHSHEQMVKPKVVYISQPTELGTIYKKAELQGISDYCRQNDLYLYLDGARLGSALMSRESDLNLQEITQMVDMFYIGGTKNGALLGEAMVIVNPVLKENFRFHLKQRGALLAKGRTLALQFVALFTDNLYFELATHANEQAEKITKTMCDLGLKFLTESSTNQIFPILPNAWIEELQKSYGFYFWSKVDSDHSAIRLVTSWATQDQHVEMFLEELKKIIGQRI